MDRGLAICHLCSVRGDALFLFSKPSEILESGARRERSTWVIDRYASVCPGIFLDLAVQNSASHFSEFSLSGPGQGSGAAKSGLGSHKRNSGSGDRERRSPLLCWKAVNPKSGPA